MTNLTTAAWVGHDLALAAGLGSGLFKQLALPKGIERVAGEQQRAEALTQSWKAYAPIGGIAMTIAAGTWLIGRLGIDGGSIGDGAKGLVIAKDVCIAGALGTGIAGMVLDFRMASDARVGALRVGKSVPAMGSEPTAARTLKAANVVGAAHMLCIAGAMALTTILSMKAGKSSKWSFVSRLLP